MVLADARTERDTFLAVVYADADWLRAEFDAIVEASWYEPPAEVERPGRPAAAPVPATGAGFRDRALPAERPVAACPARERSPPGTRLWLRRPSVWSSP
jgi:hypothetical protein